MQPQSREIYENKRCIIVDSESTGQGTPYLVAFASNRFGSEVYIITEGMQEQSNTGKLLAKVGAHLKEEVSINQLRTIMKQRDILGYYHWAFGATLERTWSLIFVHDLQLQREFLISKPADQGIQHNAIDEVEHLHYQFLKKHRCQEMSWNEARNDPAKKIDYDYLLVSFGQQRIHAPGAYCSTLQARIQWSDLRTRGPQDNLDLWFLKEQIYREAFLNSFSKIQFHVLCEIAKQVLSDEHRETFDAICFEGRPFSIETPIIEEQFNHYCPKAMISLSLKPQADSKYLPKGSSAKLDNQVKSGDRGALRTTGSDYQGDCSSFNWSEIFGRFFSKLIKQLIRQENNEHNQVEDTFAHYLPWIKLHEEFFFDKWEHLPPTVQRYFMLVGLTRDDVVMRGKPIWKSKRKPAQAAVHKDHDNNHGYSTDPLTIIRDKLLLPFPKGGEIYEREEDPSMRITRQTRIVDYRLDFGVFTRQQAVFSPTGTDLRIYSMSDDMCGFKALASLCYKDPQNLGGYEDAFASATVSAQGKLGHTAGYLRRVCAVFGINCMDYAQFYGILTNKKIESFRGSTNETGLPLFPCILMDRGHVNLVMMGKRESSEKSEAKKFTYYMLEQAFSLPVEAEHIEVELPPTRTNKKTKPVSRSVTVSKDSIARKRVHKAFQKQQKIRHREKKVRANQRDKALMDPEEAAMRRAHYMLRRNLDIDKSTLPKVHLDDPFVAQFVLEFMFKLQIDTRAIPNPRSQKQYVYLASLQKKKHGGVFVNTGPVKADRYILHPDIIGQVDTHVVPMPPAEMMEDELLCGREIQSALSSETDSDLVPSKATIAAAFAVGTSAYCMYKGLGEKTRIKEEAIHEVHNRQNFTLQWSKLSKGERPESTPDHVVDQTISDIKEFTEGIKALKLIDAASCLESDTGTIVEAYCGANAGGLSTDRSTQKTDPFQTFSPRFKKYSEEMELVNKATKINIQGNVMKIFWQWCAIWGLDLRLDDMKVAGQASGGHTALRTFVNYLQAKQLDDIAKKMNELRRPAAEVDNAHWEIVCIGDKFKSCQSKLNGVLEWTLDLLCERPQALAADATQAERDQFDIDLHYYYRCKEAWANAIRRVNNENIVVVGSKRHRNNNQSNRKFLRYLAQEPIWNFEQRDKIQKLMSRRDVTHTAVRPMDNVYDRTYLRNNLRAFHQNGWKPGWAEHTLEQMTIQEYDTAKANTRVIYWMVDVHYYLDGWTPKNTKDCDYYTCVGANFTKTPGQYILPFGEGEYKVWGSGKIDMKTRTSGHWYEHDHVILGNVEKEMPFGWYTYCVANGNPADFVVKKMEAVDYDTDKSIQSTWLAEKLVAIKGTHSGKIASDNLIAAWSDEDACEFISALKRSRSFEELDQFKYVQIMSYFKTAPKVISVQKKEEEENYRFEWTQNVRNYLWGQPVTSVKNVGVPYNEVSQRNVQTKADLQQLERRERDEPLNAKGAFQHIDPWYKPNVRYLSDTQRQLLEDNSHWKIEAINYIIATRKKYNLPDSVVPVLPANDLEKNMLLRGRGVEETFKADADHIKEKPRGHHMIVACQLGEGSENHQRVIEKYICYNRAAKVKRTKLALNSDEALKSGVAIRMDDYYQVKEPEYEVFDEFNPSVVPDPLNYLAQTSALVKLTRDQQELMAVHKDKLVPLYSIQAGKVVSKSGSRVISEALGVPIYEFEYSHKALSNILWATQRHCQNFQQPDPEHIARFGPMCETAIGTFVAKILAENPVPEDYMMSYPASQHAWSNAKKENYERNIWAAYNDPAFYDYLQSFELMVKSGEVQTSVDFEYDDKRHLLGQRS